MNKRILITGGTGLLALNWAIKKRDEQHLFLLQHQRAISLSGTTPCKFDLSSKDEITAAIEDIKPDLIVHAAGLTSVEKCEADPKLAAFTNVNLSKNIAEVSQHLGIRLLYISTDHLSDGKVAYQKEEDAIHPLNQYAISKAMAEKTILEACDKALVIRTNIFGWGTSYRTSFSDFIISNLRKGNEIQLFSDVNYTPVLIADLLDIIEKLLGAGGSGIFNIGSADRISKYEFGQTIAMIFGLDATKIQKISIDEKTDLVSRPKDMSLSTEKISQLLGHTPPIVKDGILRLKQQEELGLAKELGAL